MPCLDLDQADIDRPTQHSLDKLLAPMLWPNDADAQSRYLKASLARQAYEDAKTLPPHPLLGVPVMPAAAVVLVYEACDSMRYFESKKFARELVQQLDRGMFVGQTLSETIGAHDLSLNVRGRGAVGLEIVDDVDAFQFSDRTAERVWGDFAPVAHLWAAYVHLLNEAKLNNIRPPKPPCRASQLGFLLAYSEALVERGETTKSAPNAPAVIVKPGRAYRVSPKLVLPKVSIRFERK